MPNIKQNFSIQSSPNFLEIKKIRILNGHIYFQGATRKNGRIYHLRNIMLE